MMIGLCSAQALRQGPCPSSYCSLSARSTTGSVAPELSLRPRELMIEAPAPTEFGIASLRTCASDCTALDAFSWVRKPPDTSPVSRASSLAGGMELCMVFHLCARGETAGHDAGSAGRTGRPHP